MAKKKFKKQIPPKLIAAVSSVENQKFLIKLSKKLFFTQVKSLTCLIIAYISLYIVTYRYTLLYIVLFCYILLLRLNELLFFPFRDFKINFSKIYIPYFFPNHNFAIVTQSVCVKLSITRQITQTNIFIVLEKFYIADNRFGLTDIFGTKDTFMLLENTFLIK